MMDMGILLWQWCHISVDGVEPELWYESKWYISSCLELFWASVSKRQLLGKNPICDEKLIVTFRCGTFRGRSSRWWSVEGHTVFLRNNSGRPSELVVTILMSQLWAMKVLVRFFLQYTSYLYELQPCSNWRCSFIVRWKPGTCWGGCYWLQCGLCEC